MKSNLPRLFQVVALLWILQKAVGAGTYSQADFFDIIGKTPAEVAATIPNQYPYDDVETLVSGFVGLPMSDAHRKDFVEGLRVTIKEEPAKNIITRHCLLNLLEEDGACDTALEIIRSLATKPGYESIREIGFLWKAGEESAAADLVDSLANLKDDYEVWLSLARVDLIKNRPEDAMRLLGFLEKRTKLPARLRHMLALQHLEIARRNGGATELIDKADSPVLRAVWNSALGLKDHAIENAKTAGPGVCVEDIELLLLAIGPDSPAEEYAKAALRKPDMTLEHRRTLLGCFKDVRRRFEVWLTMGAGHSETTDLLEPLESAVPGKEASNARHACIELLNANPGDARLGLLVALLSSRQPDQGKSYLMEVAKAVLEKPTGYSQFADPANTALGILVKSTDAAELEKLLLGAPGFKELPPPDQLRYLMTADLDLQVVAAMRKCVSDPAALELLSGSVPEYFKRRAFGHVIPDEVMALLLDHLPDLAMADASKPGHSFYQSTRSWLDFIGSQKISEDLQVKVINRLVAVAAKQNDDVRNSVIGGFPEFVWSLEGLNFKRPERKTALPVSASPTPCSLLSIFSPPNPMMIGNNFSENRSLRLYQSRPGIPTKDFSDRILIVSPWRQNFFGISSPMGFDPVIQAKLRMLFCGNPSRTIIYDLLVYNGTLQCPDPEVKVLAEQQIAAINTPFQEDPAAGVYLFFNRLGKGEPADKAAAVLDGYEQYPLPIRNRMAQVLNYMHGAPIAPSVMELVRAKLGFVRPDASRQQPKAPEPPSVYDRIQFFEEAGKLDSPECIALARQVLFDFLDNDRAISDDQGPFVDSHHYIPGPQENIAIRTLVVTKHFNVFLDDLKRRLNEAGKSELEIQRALYRVHLYRIVHSEGEIFPFAKRILELDPNDAAAAADALAAAVLEKNRPLALKAMETLYRQVKPITESSVLSARRTSTDKYPDAFSLFTGSQARELAETLLRIQLPPNNTAASYGGYSPFGFTALYLHFIQHDMESLKPLLRWAGGMSPANGRQLCEIADYLIRMKRNQDALDLLAEAYFTPLADAPPDKFRFAPKTVPDRLDQAPLSIGDLQRLELLKPLAVASRGFPKSPSTEGVRLMIELAANPNPDTWNRLVKPYLADQPLTQRPELRRVLMQIVESQPDSAALRQQLALEDAPASKRPPTLDSVSQKLGLAAEANDGSQVAEDWAAAKQLLAGAPAQRRLEFLVRNTLRLARIANDAEWNEYLEHVRKTAGFSEAWMNESSSSMKLADLATIRLKNIAAIVLADLKPGAERTYGIMSIFNQLSSVESPDVPFLQKFQPWIEYENQRQNRDMQASTKLQFLDLLSGNLAAASPQLAARAESDSSWRIDWSLAGCKGYRTGYPFARTFPFMDGKFDIEILAGAYSDRLDRVGTVEKAGATGSLSVKLPAGTRFAGLLARQRDGGIIRMANPVELSDQLGSELLEFTSKASGKPEVAVKLERLAGQGPFFNEDAFDFTAGPDVVIELAKLPWNPGLAPLVTGWFLQPKGYGYLMLSFRNAADIEIKAESFQPNGPDLDGMPLWQRFKTPSDMRVPPETEKIALVYKSNRYGEATQVRLSEVRVMPAKEQVFPAGLTLLGRVPASIGFIAMDMMGNRFATASNQCVGVFDFETRQFSGWIPLNKPEAKASGDGIHWLALAGNRILCVTRTGDVHLVSIRERTARVICKIDDINNLMGSEKQIQLSPDGTFLAWGGTMAGLHLVKIENDGGAKQRLLETPQIQDLAFDPKKQTLEARDGVNRYSLPLADWEKAPLKAVRDDGSRDPEQSSRRLMHGSRESFLDSLNQVQFHIGYASEMPAELEVKSRTVTLPQGLLGLDQQGLMFYISPLGQILRIETTKLKGFEAPVQR